MTTIHKAVNMTTDATKAVRLACGAPAGTTTWLSHHWENVTCHACREKLQARFTSLDATASPIIVDTTEAA